MTINYIEIDASNRCECYYNPDVPVTKLTQKKTLQ
jgi:hypothetical protein